MSLQFGMLLENGRFVFSSKDLEKWKSAPLRSAILRRAIVEWGACSLRSIQREMSARVNEVWVGDL